MGLSVNRLVTMQRLPKIVFLIAIVSLTLAAAPVSAFTTAEIGPQLSTDSVGEAASNTAKFQLSNSSNSSVNVSPGARLAGIIGVQEAEIKGAIDERVFTIQLSTAANETDKARIVGNQLSSIQNRLEALKNQKQALEQAKANGNISTNQYKARLTALAAKIQSVKQLTNQSESAALNLPTELRERNGINITAIQTLKQDANDLSGPEVAQIARQIAGPDVGKSIASKKASERAGPPDDRNSTGPPSNVGTNRSNSAGNPQNGADSSNNSTGRNNEANDNKGENMNTGENRSNTTDRSDARNEEDPESTSTTSADESSETNSTENNGKEADDGQSTGADKKDENDTGNEESQESRPRETQTDQETAAPDQ